MKTKISIMFAVGTLFIVAGAPQYDAIGQTSSPRVERTGKEVVESLCTHCHATGVKGAPRIGDPGEWSRRLSHGLDNAVQVAIRGHGSMPARGGKADLTDNEVRNAIVYMFNPSTLPKASAAVAPAPAKPPGDLKTVGRTEIYLGLLPAEVLRSYPKDSVERAMHGGVPSGAGQYHLNVSVIDAVSKAPISGARVEVKIEDPGISSEAIPLEAITINSMPSYGNYIQLKRKTQYSFIVRVRTPNSAQPIEATFAHRVY